MRVVWLSATSCQAGQLDPGGALDHGALVTFAGDDDDPVTAHGAPVTGVEDVFAAVPDHGARVDGCAKLMFLVLDDVEGLG